MKRIKVEQIAEDVAQKRIEDTDVFNKLLKLLPISNSGEFIHADDRLAEVDRYGSQASALLKWLLWREGNKPIDYDGFLQWVKSQPEFKPYLP
jgi:hypothetical protein